VRCRPILQSLLIVCLFDCVVGRWNKDRSSSSSSPPPPSSSPLFENLFWKDYRILMTLIPPHNNKLPLQFEFKGYSVWLEPVQYDNDLSLAIKTASQELGVLPIPMPHVTAIYGMSHLSSETEAIRRFRNAILECRSTNANNNNKHEKWPSSLEYKGIVSGVEWDGINGGTMVRVGDSLPFLRRKCVVEIRHVWVHNVLPFLVYGCLFPIHFINRTCVGWKLLLHPTTYTKL
jgi:hypothetical protein